MTKCLNIILIASLLVVVVPLTSQAEHVVDDSLRYQFVLSGNKGSLKEGTLTLSGIPIVSFYSLGKVRGAGHFFIESFVEVWNNNAKVFEKDPPNATLSVLSAKGSSGAVVELSEPTANLNSISFKARVLEGAILRGVRLLFPFHEARPKRAPGDPAIVIHIRGKRGGTGLPLP